MISQPTLEHVICSKQFTHESLQSETARLICCAQRDQQVLHQRILLHTGKTASKWRMDAQWQMSSKVQNKSIGGLTERTDVLQKCFRKTIQSNSYFKIEH